MRNFCLALCLVLTARAVEAPNQNAGSQLFVVGLSPYLERSVKDEVFRGLVRLLVEDLPLNSKLSIYDAFELKTITQVTLPDSRVFSSSKTRANQFAPAIRELKAFLATDHVKPANKRLHFESALHVPQFADFIADNVKASERPVTVLLVGSPLYQDPKEPSFSMIDGYFPSDGHLQASREDSVFGFTGQTNRQPAMTVYWLYFGDPWMSDLHKEKVMRFWTLYFERRGGELASFTQDLPTSLQAVCHLTPGTPAAARGWALDSRQTKLEMLRVSRSVEVTDWITRDTLPEMAPQPPTVMIGPMKIGIRWKDNIDLDLYSAPRHGAETLFFQHTRSPEGYYYKDHRHSPGREYEFIEFESPVDCREVEAFVNFYKGSRPNGPRGEVRIEFDGRIYSGKFSIEATEGNQGRTGSEQEQFWTRIPVREILRIPTSTERASNEP
ncbi:MAG TPA: hypothetical protein VL361_20255 [Candidatus Limnocylindrales bacterium]|jgi:hypothetical protein|nr:hypothetical protein [Candidatus Limnocylindrales bacterium]